METPEPRPAPSGGALGCSALAGLGMLALSGSLFRSPWQLLDPGPPPLAVALGLLLWLAPLSLYALRLRRLPGPWRTRLFGLLSLALLLAPLVAFAASAAHRAANCALDRSPPSRAEAVVLRTEAVHGARRRLVAVLSRTALREGPVAVELSTDTFARLHQGDRVSIETRPGALGREWCREPCVGGK